MPTEPLAALLYVGLLLPGIAFIRAYEGHRPIIKRSAFRESATVVIASAGALLFILILHYILGFVFAPAREALEQFFIDPAMLFREDSQLFIGVALADLTLAILFAAALGSAWATRLAKVLRSSWFDLRKKDHPGVERGLSAWNYAFERFPEHQVLVGIHLKSGGWLEGPLDTYTDSGDEKPERALTLTGEISYRRHDGETVHRLEPHTSIVVQATEIEYLTVGYEATDSTLESDQSMKHLPEGDLPLR